MSDTVPGLSSVESRLLKLCGERAISNTSLSMDTQIMFEQSDDAGIPQDKFFDTLKSLKSKGYVEIREYEGLDEPPSFVVTQYGFDEFVKAYRPDHPR